MTHVLERVILPYNDSEIRERVKNCARSMFETFTFPDKRSFWPVDASRSWPRLSNVRSHRIRNLPGKSQRNE
jgi:hypothetical protein